MKYHLLAIGPLVGILVAACGDDATSTSASGGTESTTSGQPTTSSGGNGQGGNDGGGGEGGSPPPLTISKSMSDDIVQSPQYVTVRKSPTEGVKADEQARCEALLPELAGLPFVGNDHTCVVFNPYILDLVPDQAQRQKVLQAGFNEVRVVVGAEVFGDRRLAVEAIIDVLNGDPDRLKLYLHDILVASRAAKVPVVIDLDAVNWWGGRPDLWNFFDQAKDGYDPANVDNVEWAGSDPSTATKVFWRNWGAQIRVETPIPNLGGPKVRAAIHDVLGELLPEIKTFVDDLAPDERWLYGGTIIGTELAVGVNHYYYPNGNQYLGQPNECDPGLSHAGNCAGGGGNCSQYNHGVCPPNFNNSPSGGVAQVGYKSAIDLGISGAGEPLNQAKLDAVIQNYVAFFEQELIAGGLPENMIHSHTGGAFGPNGPQSLFAARAGTVTTGWSMYFEGSNKPSISSFVESSDDQRPLPWSTPEWLPIDPNGGSANAWKAAWDANLDYRNNRLVSLANWEGVYKNGNAMAGTKATLTTPSFNACVVVPRVYLGSAELDGTVGIRFSAARPGTVTYLVASTSPEQKVGGGLANIDVTNAALPNGETSYFFEHADNIPAYVQLVTDGCNAQTGGARVFSDVFKVDVHGNGMAPNGARLYTRRIGPRAIFSWDVPGGAASVHFQVGADESFSTLVVDEDVTGKSAFVRDGFVSAPVERVRLLVDGAPSNVVTP